MAPYHTYYIIGVVEPNPPFLVSSTLVFIIGGSLGVNDNLRNIVNYNICFSKMTFPHQLFRIFLVEQIYRSFKIINNETYHK